ncbi:MAG: hypothetical protein JWM59_1924 [Verrucomicrobiales bacterium]|nr:hypothetical protein [Verrucomicrobiales bacterium]
MEISPTCLDKNRRQRQFPGLSDMKQLTFLLPACTALVLVNCAGLPGETPAEMRTRVDRQDQRFYEREEKRKIRSEAADRRYDTWWKNSTGHQDGGW